MEEITIEYNGERRPLTEWADMIGINSSTLRRRLKTMPLERAMQKGRLNNSTYLTGNGKKWELDGEWHTIDEWSSIYGIKASTIRSRMDDGWSLRRAVTTPKGFIRKYLYNGTEYTLRELSRMSGISADTLRQRIKSGKTVEEAMAKPPSKRVLAHGYADKKVRCTRYDCLYQDGSGICFLDFKNNNMCGDSYRDAYDYYYGKGNTEPPMIGKKKRRGMKRKNGALQYCGSGSVYVFKAAQEEAQPTDWWSRDRKILLSGSIPD